jgi:hypothetical protein
MHQWSAVGKTVKANVDASKKGLYIVAKIIDNQAWEKVKEGVYNGFSIGGQVLKKVNNIIEELSLNEISLVDRPANPLSVFSLVKFDKNGELINKMPVGIGNQIETEVGKMPHEGIIIADKIVAITTQLVYLSESLKNNGKNNKQLSRAINSLKRAAKLELDADKVAIADPFWRKGYFETLRKVL